MSKCNHKWRTVKKKITITEPEFEGINAWFIFIECESCKKYQIVDYKVS